jgi:hypothetical protein
MYTHTHTHTHVCICVYVYVCVCVCVCVPATCFHYCCFNKVCFYKYSILSISELIANIKLVKSLMWQHYKVETTDIYAKANIVTCVYVSVLFIGCVENHCNTFVFKHLVPKHFCLEVSKYLCSRFYVSYCITKQVTSLLLLKFVV